MDHVLHYFCSSRVLINDQPFGLIKPARGIRQGNPLCPFMFVLCTERLTYMMNNAAQSDWIHGLSFSQQGPLIHHLLYADDRLFICKAKVNEVKKKIQDPPGLWYMTDC